jgi:hypothetical protein
LVPVPDSDFSHTEEVSFSGSETKVQEESVAATLEKIQSNIGLKPAIVALPSHPLPLDKKVVVTPHTSSLSSSS